MNWKRNGILLFAASILILSAQVQATTMLKMDLEDLASRAGTIFRGTVIDVEQGTIEAGGGELPAVTYRFRVVELYKGSATDTKGDNSIMVVRTVGSLAAPKPDEDGNLRFSLFSDVPKFDKGGDYLLFTTPESSIGLSVTVGLGQGAFRVSPIDGTDEEFQAVNEFNNAGLGLDGDGPVELDKLSASIRALLAR